VQRGMKIILTSIENNSFEIETNDIVEYKKLPHGFRYIRLNTNDEYMIRETMSDILDKARKKWEDNNKEYEEYMRTHRW
jgi:hypothetical protein